MALTLTQLVEQYQEDYRSAPQYKSYSQALRKNIPPKSQVQSEFIANLQMLSITTDDPVVEEKIAHILKKYE